MSWKNVIKKGTIAEIKTSDALVAQTNNVIKTLMEYETALKAFVKIDMTGRGAGDERTAQKDAKEILEALEKLDWGLMLDRTNSILDNRHRDEMEGRGFGDW